LFFIFKGSALSFVGQKKQKPSAVLAIFYATLPGQNSDSYRLIPNLWSLMKSIICFFDNQYLSMKCNDKSQIFFFNFMRNCDLSNTEFNNPTIQ